MAGAGGVALDDDGKASTVETWVLAERLRPA
jgi:hypothetical protein